MPGFSSAHSNSLPVGARATGSFLRTRNVIIAKGFRRGHLAPRGEVGRRPGEGGPPRTTSIAADDDRALRPGQAKLFTSPASSASSSQNHAG